MAYDCSNRLDSSVIEGLDKIAHNQQYLDSLIFTLNYQQQGSQQGIEPESTTSGYTAERTRQIIKTITNAYKLPGKNEKELILKRHIKQVNYSKDNIEVEINYPDQPIEFSENGAEKPTDGNMPAYRTGKSAACFWVAAKTGRRPTPLKQKSAFAKAPADKTSDFENSTVRIAKLIAPRGIEPRF